MLKMFKPLFCCLFFLVTICRAQTNALSVAHHPSSFPLFTSSTVAGILIDEQDAKVVHIAAEAFIADVELISGKTMQLNKRGNAMQVIAGTIGQSKHIDQLIKEKRIDVRSILHKWERFLIKVIAPNKLIIAGSDPRGTAFGIFHLSRAMGVSPWVWWADVTPQKKKQLYVSGSYLSKEPTVKYRGIFLNDEDWGLQPWAAKTFEPETGDIGPKTYAKIFELLLRLRANMIWPAMHPSTKAFFHYPGNAQMATDYAIVVGSSHAEPMLRNNVDEWKEKTMGEFNFITNHDTIYNYWEERVIQSKGLNAFYTLGIRGVHDSKMLGANTLQEQKLLLDKAVKEQREMLAKHNNPDITKVPQAFIPYKEVQDIYDAGFEVPQDVTLVWCDDNYGYIRHFPNEKERTQTGGNGVYYHLSYWGRPHDYLWLSSTHPAQMYTQMRMAYDKGARNMWIVNVGDIKPGEYLTELFLDMAWNIDSIANNQKGLEQHLHNWLTREFGTANAKDLVAVMNEYYRLAYIRKPEFMGATRTEESDPKYKVVTDLPWSEEEINQRLKEYAAIDTKIVQLTKRMSSTKQDSWFQLIEYPVRGAAAINRKLLYAQLARHNKGSWALSDAAYDSVVAFTNRYNSLANGKWKYMMDMKPRKLAVFDKADRQIIDKPLVQTAKPLCVFNGTGYQTFYGQKPLAHGMGYQRGAVSVAKGSAVTYTFTSTADSAKIVLALAPHHPVEGTKIRYSIQVDDGPVQTVDYATQGRSEEWKQNVLTNQANRTTTHAIGKNGKHVVKITAVDEGVIVDQVKVMSSE
ncbi:glycosyl hydrolase family 115 (putative glucuronidase) [Lacibacter cauensis]|uniref:Glycosyl hydrolase family 115 (Putative glucuronidase) n=1 Tax=Lacibacter cauensis TaxID=510947 RepID=A0A562SXA3_9BACT|nr:glycosyl hydrolase 115 family protein [Lacibacter cauensis]TWI85604.1 glycosyl hydrolase family 115 (putative glucuronidase) [Lacibacter cauensis]